MTVVVSEWQRNENNMGKDDEAGDDFFFYPHDWISGGYHLTGIDGDLMETLETRKKRYMEDRGYIEEGNNGYDAGLERTARLLEKTQDSRKYISVGEK